MDNRPVGFLDSGLGGISVLGEALRELPNENFVYFGDTKHMLGDKVQGSAFVNDFPFDDLLALRAALGGFLSFVYVPADGADEFFLHNSQLLFRQSFAICDNSCHFHMNYIDTKFHYIGNPNVDLLNHDA